MTTTKIEAQKFQVKSVDLIKSDFNTGIIDKRNIQNGNYDMFLMIRFVGGGYTKVKVGFFSHSNGGMCQFYVAQSNLVQESEMDSKIISSKFATTTATAFGMRNELIPQVKIGDTVTVSGRKKNTKYSWAITHAKVELN